jgi:hypothetical protein
MCPCSKCEQTVAATRNTGFFALRPPAEQVMMALKRRQGKGGLAALGFVLGVTAETVRRWLARAAHQAHEMTMPLRRNLPLTQGQLDELWRLSRRTHAPLAEANGASSDQRAAGR